MKRQLLELEIAVGRCIEEMGRAIVDFVAFLIVWSFGAVCEWEPVLR